MTASTATDTVGAGVRRAAPLALAGLLANAANVVVTVVLARLLATRGYGALNQLTGVFWVVSTPGTAVVVAVVRRVTAPGGSDAVAGWARRLHRRGVVALFGVAGLALVVGPSLARALGRSDPRGLEAAVVAGAVWILLGLDRGLLQAGRAYRSLSHNLLWEGAARTGAMLALGAAFGVSGAALGLLLAEVATAAHARVAARRVWARTAVEGSADRRDRRAVVDLAVAVLALLLLAVLQQGDVIVMGAEGPGAAGAYAAVSVSCKALVFGALVVAGYLLPEAAIRWRQGSHALRQLGACGVLLGAPAVVLLTVAAAVPGPFLSTVFSHRYRSAAGAFLPLAAVMVFLAATVVVTLYLLGVGERRVVVVLAFAAAALLAATVACQGRPIATAGADLVVQGACALVVGAELVVVHRRRLPHPRLRSRGNATLVGSEG